MGGAGQVTGFSSADSARRVATSLAPGAAILLVQLVGFPLSRGLFLRGLIVGALTALAAVGMALLHRTHGVVTLALVHLGIIPAVLCYLLMEVSGLPWPLATAVGVGAAAGLGLAAARVVVGPLAPARRSLTLATIALTQFLAGVAVLLPALWGRGATGTGAGGRMPGPFEHRWTVGDIGFDVNDLLALIVVPACLVLVVVFLYRSHLGGAVRAAADGGERLALLGVPVGRVHGAVWMVAAVLAYVTVFLRSGALGVPVLGLALGIPLLLRTLAAFLAGGRDDLAGVVTAALALGVLEEGVRHNHGTDLIEPVLAAVAVVALLVPQLRRRRGRPALRPTGRVPWWQLPGEVRPVPSGLAELATLGLARRAGVIGLVGGVLVLPWLLSPDSLHEVTVLLVYGVVGVSLVVLSGWSGAISLGHAGLAAAGAAVGAWSSLTWQLDLLPAVVLAAATGALAAVAAGLATLRLPGSGAALGTFVVALGATTYLLDPDRFSWVPEGRQVGRGSLVLGLDLASTDRQVYFVALVLLALVVAAVRNLRASSFGRTLVAARDDAAVARAYGIDGTRSQPVAYALSGALAASAGAVLVQVEGGFDRATFTPLEGFEMLTMVVIGGMGSVAGAVLGAFALVGSRWLLPDDAQMAVAGAAALLVLLRAPDGLAGLAVAGRDRALGRLARARGLDIDGDGPGPAVPSAAAGPPEAMAAEPSPGSGAPAGHRPVLSVRGLSAGHGGPPVLEAVDLDVAPGEVVAVLGTGGAGKSTLLRVVSGLTRPSAGEVVFDGVPIAGRPPSEITALGLIHLPGGPSVLPSLTVAENLRMASWLHRDDPEAIAAGMDRLAPLFPMVRDRAHRLAGTLPSGQQHTLALAMAVLGRPKLLMVDEPSPGLEPAVAGERARIADHLRDEGTALLLVVERRVDAALEVADRAVVLEQGRVSFSGSADELAGRHELLRPVLPGPVPSGAAPATGPDRPGRPERPEAPPPRARPGRSAERGTTGEWPSLQVMDLSAAPGGVPALDGVSLDVAHGETLGLVGPDHAGKAALLDVVSGALAHDAGWVLLDGHDIGHLRAPARARRGVARSFRDARLFPSMTVADTLAAALQRSMATAGPVPAALRLPRAVARERALRRRVDELLELAGLEGRQGARLGELPASTRRVVELACLLAHEPVAVLLDEPATGVPRAEVPALARWIGRVRDDSGAGLLLVEHDVALLLELADRLVAVDAGRVIATGAPGTVLADPAVVASYRAPTTSLGDG